MCPAAYLHLRSQSKGVAATRLCTYTSTRATRAPGEVNTLQRELREHIYKFQNYDTTFVSSSAMPTGLLVSSFQTDPVPRFSSNTPTLPSSHPTASAPPSAATLKLETGEEDTEYAMTFRFVCVRHGSDQFHASTAPSAPPTKTPSRPFPAKQLRAVSKKASSRTSPHLRRSSKRTPPSAHAAVARHCESEAVRPTTPRFAAGLRVPANASATHAARAHRGSHAVTSWSSALCLHLNNLRRGGCCFGARGEDFVIAIGSSSCGDTSKADLKRCWYLGK